MKYTELRLKQIYGDGKGRARFGERLDKLALSFYDAFGLQYEDVFSSPGRVELCGNHTDHNNGKVLVGAIDCDMLAVTARAKEKVEIHSEGFLDIAFDIDDTRLVKEEIGSSKAIAKGILQGFKDEGFKVGGFKLVMNSTIFKGAGVSSSAAFEVLLAEILNFYYNGDKIDKFKLAEIGKFSENVYMGKPCGLLDQSGIALGGISLIDFENPTKPKVESLGNDLAGLEIVLINTGDHSDLTNEYAQIRAEMGEIANYFGKKSLREVDRFAFDGKLGELKEKFCGRAILRALHYFDENERVVRAGKAIKDKSTEKLLTVINESGLSSAVYLQNNHVSGDLKQSISVAVALSKEMLKTGAARVHGGGFAGTCLVLVKKAEKAEFVRKISEIFGKKNVFEAVIRESGATHI